MFTGIITDIGKLNKKNNFVFTFNASHSFCKRLKHGTSVAVNGVCLTVFNKQSKSFSIEITPETQKRTTLGKIKSNNPVNLELPLTLNTFLSGHLVQGHIDGKGKIVLIKKEGNSKVFKIKIPDKAFSKFLVYKGSVVVEGVSLTVTKVLKDYFVVKIIPYTLASTNLKYKKKNDMVNLEFDILAKYANKK